MEDFVLQRMLTDSSELGGTRALIGAGLLTPFISQTQAYKMYGEGLVKKLVTEGRIERHKTGVATSGVKYERMQLETAIKAYNLKRTVLINQTT